jgi:hypothetical protein
LIRLPCGVSVLKTKLDANALFGTFTHRKKRYDIIALVTFVTIMARQGYHQNIPCDATTSRVRSCWMDFLRGALEKIGLLSETALTKKVNTQTH